MDVQDFNKFNRIGREYPLSISWDLVTHCQLNCSYCYYRPYTSQTKYEDIMNLVLNRLKAVDGPFEVSLLGGEPTLHPHFAQLISRLCSINNLLKISVVTNFMAPLEFWRSLEGYSDKLEIIPSFHAEYFHMSFFEKILLLKNNFSFNLGFVLHHSADYLPQMKQAIEYYINYLSQDVRISFNKLVNKNGNEERYYAYDLKVLEFIAETQNKFKAKFALEIVQLFNDNEISEISQWEFGENNLNRVKGWSCHMSSLVITADGHVIYPCTYQKKHILFANLEKRNLICPLDFCPSEAFWNYQKIRPTLK